MTKDFELNSNFSTQLPSDLSFVIDSSTGRITGYSTEIGGADTIFPFYDLSSTPIIMDGATFTVYNATDGQWMGEAKWKVSSDGYVKVIRWFNSGYNSSYSLTLNGSAFSLNTIVSVSADDIVDFWACAGWVDQTNITSVAIVSVGTTITKL